MQRQNGMVFGITIFFALMLTGCAVSPTGTISTGTSAGACAGAQLSVMTDGDLQVIGVDRNGAAERAGVQVGDVLVDLTLIEVGPGQPCNDVIPVGPDGSPLVISGGIAVPAPRDTSIYPTGPVPFTDRDAIRTLTDYGLTLQLRVQRNGAILELPIKPSAPGERYTPGDPTPTAIPPSSHYDYF